MSELSHKIHKTISLLLTVSLLFGLLGCEDKSDTVKDKLTISLEFDDSSSIFNYIIELRDVFPEYEFEFQSIVRRGHMDGIADKQQADVILSQAAANSDVADIIISDAFSDRIPNLTNAFAEVSGEHYTSHFQTSHLNKVAIDGKLYYLPFFIGLKGIVYNQTMFEENGWEVPQSYAEFTELLTTIYQSGQSPISVRTFTDLGAGLVSTSFLINDGATLAGHNWLTEFSVNNPVANRTTFSGTLSYLRMLDKVGHIADDPQAFDRPIAYLMKDRDVAMCIANGESLSQVYNSGTHDKFAMMPLYSEAFPDGVIIEHNTLYMGMSAKAMEDPEKAEALNKIAEYIYSEKGQLRLLESCRGLVSPCYGLMEDLNSRSLSEFKRVLESGNLVEEVAPFSVDISFDESVMEYLFSDTTIATEDKLLADLNHARALWLASDRQKQKVLAKATETFSEQQVLNFTMEAMKTQTKSDIAIVPAMTRPDYYGHPHDTQIVHSKLYEGEVTLPILESTLIRDYDVSVYTMSGEQILALVDANKTNNVCLGITLDYTYHKEKDIYLLTGAHLPDGEPLNPDAEYKVCMSSNLVLSENGYIHAGSFESTLTETLASYCASQASISPFDLPEPNYMK